MNRRDFLKVTTAALVTSFADAENAGAAQFLNSSGMVNMESAPLNVSSKKDGEGLKVRFLGTGAADWKKPLADGSYRRLSSILLDDRILIDLTPSSATMLPLGCKPEAIFYTHSHRDHFHAQTCIDLGIKEVYCHSSMVEYANTKYNGSGNIHSLEVGESVIMENIVITALPANHATGNLKEQALIYLIEKGSTRLLYATDTAGIPAIAARLAGIDAHRDGIPITAFIMEATMGEKYDVDFRIYTHSSVQTVKRTVDVLLKTGRYTPAEGQKVYITHLARTLHPSQEELARTLPEPLAAAYDGLEVIF